jgi:hypothetical protein
MPSRLLDKRIRDLCAKAVAADTVNFAEVLEELRSALHEHAEEMRKLARKEIARREQAHSDTFEEEPCKALANRTNE